MISASDTSVSDAAAFLGARGVTATFLVPTATGLEKSILDATEPVRRYLADSGVHNYAEQPQGQADKVILRAYFHSVVGTRETTVSLYRPETKTGDPRIWFSGLNHYAQAGNLLAIFAHGTDDLHVVNMSEPSVVAMFDDPETELARTARAQSRTAVAEELFAKLREIALAGWIASKRVSDTGIGFTLETLLGINANSSKSPDYKGIELKAGRHHGPAGSKRSNRVTLFSQVPDWKLTNTLRGLDATTAVALITGDPTLGTYHATVLPRANPQGVRSQLQQRGADMHFQTVLERQARQQLVHVWDLAKLQRRLKTKHPETYFVTAEARMRSDGIEEFRYTTATYTSGPVVANLGPMLAEGTVSLDYTFRGLSDANTVRDHGYLFRTTAKHLPALMTQAKRFDLVAGVGM